GASLEQARTELAAISARLERAYPDESFGWAADPISLRDDLTGDLRKPLLVFLGAVGIVMLIACANVANLMIARGATRQRELAVRVALGAGRARIAGQVLAECALLAIAGGTAGTLLALGGVRRLRFAFPNDVPSYITFGLDAEAVLFALLLSAATAMLFGAAPALRAGDVDLNSSLREGTRGGGGGGLARGRLRSILVVAEIALSLTLMIGAALLIRSFHALETTDL